jgi:hypothetical protein
LIGRPVLVIAVALLVAVQVVRDAGVAALGTLRPAEASRFWAGHPSVEISLGLAEIGKAARQRTVVDQSAFALVDDAAVKSPLAPEPFLVHGVQAQLAGKSDAARNAFLAAQWRDPRSLPAAYFLADSYFRSGRSLQGLEQTAVLARLSPNGTAAVAPFVAAYARDRSNWPQIRALFRSQQTLEDGILTALAQDARNADAILAVADAGHRRPDSVWLRVLLTNVVASGDYGRARAIWSSIGAGHRSAGLIYDAGFSEPQAPPPFNWSFASASVGLAERQPGAKLHVIFYGNEDGPLASQLLLLSPGTYRLQMQIVGAAVHPETLHWSVRCDKSSEAFASVALDQPAARNWTFQVPPTCSAQWLELIGRSGDVAQQSDVTISGLSLTPVGTNG